MAECRWGVWDFGRGEYPCLTHAGGSLSVGQRYCSKAPGFFAELQRFEGHAFENELRRVRDAIHAFAGWHFTGLQGRSDRWAARSPSGERLTGATPEELLAKVRAACGQGPQQGVLL